MFCLMNGFFTLPSGVTMRDGLIASRLLLTSLALLVMLQVSQMIHQSETLPCRGGDHSYIDTARTSFDTLSFTFFSLYPLHRLKPDFSPSLSVTLCVFNLIHLCSYVIHSSICRGPPGAPEILKCRCGTHLPT